MILNGSRIAIGKAKLEGDVVHVIRTWATAFPAELVAFDRQMKLDRKVQYKKNGMGRLGYVRKFGDIPVRLNKAMIFQFGPDWARDNVLRDMFWDHFEVGKISKYSRMTKA